VLLVKYVKIFISGLTVKSVKKKVDSRVELPTLVKLTTLVCQVSIRRNDKCLVLSNDQCSNLVFSKEFVIYIHIYYSIKTWFSGRCSVNIFVKFNTFNKRSIRRCKKRFGCDPNLLLKKCENSSRKI